MARVRQEIRSLGETWNPTMLWYAKAVAEMRKRPITKKTSWRYLAAMHDIDEGLWEDFKEFTKGEAVPPQAEQNKYWKQCQHNTWYFWPWHRAYLLTFEDIVRDTIKELGGPYQNWALPYWNYNAGADFRQVPEVFLEKTLPDQSENKLYVEGRYGAAVKPTNAELRGRLDDSDFVGGSDVVSGGVGGSETQFAHYGPSVLAGLIEVRPHGGVHVDIGGRDKDGNQGLMASISSAALDPIFWLHHCNIDRLWEVWLQRDAGNKNPIQKTWLDGPTKPRAFALYDASGAGRPCNPKDVKTLSELGYSYDDVSDPLGGVTRRRLRLDTFAATINFPFKEIAVMPPRPTSEVIGSNDTPLALGPEPAIASIKIADAPKKQLDNTFSATLANPHTPGEPDRVFLMMENVKGKVSANFDVFIHDTTAGTAQKINAGSLSFFGLKEASQPDGHSAGSGMTQSIEITGAVDQMKMLGGSLDTLTVEIVPQSDVRKSDDITIGQITVHRQSGQ